MSTLLADSLWADSLWAGINNTFFWGDPTRRIGVVVLMQLLPFYDDAAIKVLTDVEALINRYVS